MNEIRLGPVAALMPLRVDMDDGCYGGKGGGRRLEVWGRTLHLSICSTMLVLFEPLEDTLYISPYIIIKQGLNTRISLQLLSVIIRLKPLLLQDA